MSGFLSYPDAERRTPERLGVRQSPATEGKAYPVSVAGIAASAGAVAEGAAGASPHSLPNPTAAGAPLHLLRPLAATLARIAEFGPVEFAAGMKLPPPSAPTTAPRVVTPPTVEPPTVAPHTPAISPPPTDAPPSVAQWTTADITEHPEPEAAPATHTGGPSKMTGRGRKKFVSKKQWRWAFATHKPWADRWAKKTPGGPKVRYRVLPTRKGPPTAGSLR